MIELFIDTASSRIILALLKDHKIVSIYDEKNGHDLSTRIFPLLDELLKQSDIDLNDIDTIYVVNGPGSFTGIRIGVTIAKTVAWGLNKKIIPISELELMATTDFDGDYIVPMIDARRNASFAGIYDKKGNTYLTDRYIKNDDLMNLLPKDNENTIVSYDKYDFATVVPQVKLELIIERHRNDVPMNPHQINPNYLKLTEAEENLHKELI